MRAPIDTLLLLLAMVKGSSAGIEEHQQKEVDEKHAALRAVAAEVATSMQYQVRCSLVSDAAPIRRDTRRTFSKKVWFIRHGEGYHNVAQREWRAAASWDGKSEPYTMDNDPQGVYVDAKLTSTGEAEARALQGRTASLEPQLLVVSPLRRATQTGLLAFADHVSSGRLRVIASELCHETAGRHTCDRRLPRTALAAAFSAVDYSLLESEEDPYWGDGITREPFADLARRAASFIEWLGGLPQREIAVAAHSGFLLALFNAVLTVEDEAAATWFGTGEMRCVMLTFSSK